jgi:hypothetical protein
MTQNGGRTRTPMTNAARARIGAAVSLLVLSQSMLACRSMPRQVAARDACAGEQTLVVNNKSGAAVDVFAAANLLTLPEGERILGSAPTGITTFEVTDPAGHYIARRASDRKYEADSREPRPHHRVTFDRVCAE